MYSIGMGFGLVQLFEMMNVKGGNNPPFDSKGVPVVSHSAYRHFANTNNEYQGELFEEVEIKEERLFYFNESDIAIVAGLHSARGIDFSILPQNARHLYELSINAFSAIVHAWMSELPLAAKIISFGSRILAAADMVENNTQSASRGGLELAQRQAADHVTTDRGNPDVQAVQEAAYKTWHETHRLMGLLRFSPDEDGVFIAHCEPDHFILPALGPHFRDRFCDTPWAIIDSQRRHCLRCESGLFNFFCIDENPVSLGALQNGKWENLWRHYHKTINNDSRNNPGLQRQFMPKRYWKYLTEM